MQMREESRLSVVRDGGLWGVRVDGEVMALARSKQAAQSLARDACRILRESGAESRIVPAEKRSFTED